MYRHFPIRGRAKKLDMDTEQLLNVVQRGLLTLLAQFDRW